jgi:hypothetical protein
VSPRSSVDRNVSPRILSISWGAMDIEGLGRGEDFKLWPGGGRPWDWNETGTRHDPGIQPADVVELLDHGSEVIVLSRGMQLRLQTSPPTIELLGARDLALRTEETNTAVLLYNDLAGRGISVGGLFHSTC